MLNGKSGKVGIRDQVSRSSCLRDLGLEDFPVIFRGADGSNAGLLEPAFDPFDGFVGSEGALVNSGVGGDSDVGIEDGPAKIHRLASAERGVPAFKRDVVVFREAVFCVEQDIGIRENQGRASPSVTASSSEMSS